MRELRLKRAEHEKSPDVVCLAEQNRKIIDTSDRLDLMLQRWGEMQHGERMERPSTGICYWMLGVFVEWCFVMLILFAAQVQRRLWNMHQTDILHKHTVDLVWLCV